MILNVSSAVLGLTRLETDVLTQRQWQAVSSLPIQLISLFCAPEGADRMKPTH